ncbi:redox-sensing transcriptional repressor [Draconibacterium orientale]|jgi:redox-sensing transcriptional repressor|uniref:Redox-sensing transcriptional repressor Rex n=1 Tax=Draconibacterium orientale TaxID=1168034 RepID=X5E2N1_9BACT|nr:redox-sensing transcriptional repressor Rex [Draconibacterium orientale]AHW60846.1 REX family transcriptional regulator [Draconibacterium orientale]SES67313.1 redox-sensing transcriptional repressor [Draconibacterium orientale]
MTKATKVIAVRKNKKQVPEPTLRRLPGYLFFLEKVREKGVMNISAPSIGKELKCDPTQVVKDLAFTGVKGKPRVGYNTYELCHALEKFLGFNQVNEAFLVGAGNLGSALMAYQENQTLGLKVIAAFDVDEKKIGQNIGNTPVLEYNKLFHLSNRLDVEIAILTTPNNVAQEVAEDLVNCGVKAIWNFTHEILDLPDHIIVQNTSMSSSTAVLLQRLNDSKK